jgi:lambda family phage portal protein
MNRLERAIAAVAPGWALARLQARTRFDAVNGYVAGGQTSRFGGWSGTRGSADADLLPFLFLQRQRSRDAVRNIPIASGAISSTVTAVVGTGLSLQSAVNTDELGWGPDEAEAWQAKTEREFKLWAESSDCDITRHSNFYALQALVFRSVLESGDLATLLPNVPRAGSLYDLRIQLVEADRLSNQNFAPNTDTLADGVELDQYGAPVGYWIMDQHPGTFVLKGYKWQRYAAFGAKTGRRNVLHHFHRVRPGQNRGVPFLSPVMEPIKQIGRYTDSEIMSAVVSGMFTVFVTTEGQGLPSNLSVPGARAGGMGAAGSGDQEGLGLGYGNILDLKPGESVEAPNPGRPNINFDPFVLAILRQIGMGLEIPYEVLIRHYTASYTAARAAMIDAWRFYMSRREWLIESFCQPTYETWMAEAVAKGRVHAPGFFDRPELRAAYLGSRWNGDAMPQVDPLKEVNAAGERIAIGISDRSRETSMLTGGDWEVTHAQQVREKKMRKDGGLDDPPPGATNKQLVQTAETDGGLGAPVPPGGGDLETPPTPPKKVTGTR